MPYLAFPLLEKTGLVVHAFSTRLCGVSTGRDATANFSFACNDKSEHMAENYRQMAAALGVDPGRFVRSFQTHTTKMWKVTEEYAGKGVAQERDYRDVNGLITDVCGITLVISYADCVPLYFLDPVHKAIGLSHSEWRGTVVRMGRATLRAMAQEYATDPVYALCCIGPGICQDCYEVEPEVIEEFRQAFDEKYWSEIYYEKGNGKYQLDLWKANEIILLEADVKRKYLQITWICTRCNPDCLFSHRYRGKEMGNLSASTV